MARRRLLSPEQWAGFLAAPTDERDILRYYTLRRDDLDLIAGKRTPHRRLGFALVLCYLRHPGRVLEQNEAPPSALLEFVAEQVGAQATDLAFYRRRDTSRRQHLVELLGRTRLRPFDRAVFKDIAAWLLPIAQVKREPVALATALVDELRRRRILLPSAAVLELILHQARSRAERLIHRVLVDALGPDGEREVEALLEPRANTGMAMLAWLRQAPQSPAPRNLVAVVDRLEALRRLGVDRSIQAQIPEAVFERPAGGEPYGGEDPEVRQRDAGGAANIGRRLSNGD